MNESKKTQRLLSVFSPVKCCWLNFTGYSYGLRDDSFRDLETNQILTEDRLKRLVKEPGKREIGAVRNSLVRGGITGKLGSSHVLELEQRDDNVSQSVKPLPANLQGRLYSSRNAAPGTVEPNCCSSFGLKAKMLN